MKNVEENKEPTKKLIPGNDGYKEGAIAGGLVGIVIAATLRKNLILGAVIGIVGGGYVGYMIKNNENKAQQQKIVKPKTQ